MSIAAQLAADAATFLADFGESIVYTPKVGAPITINAVIERSPQKVQPHGAVATSVETTELWMAKDAAGVIGPITVTERVDTVLFKRNLTDAATAKYRITKILFQDPGLFHLEATL